MNGTVDALNMFARDLHQHVLTEADAAEEGGLLEDVFTEYAGGILVDAGEIEDITPCTFRARGQRVSGYNICSDEETVDLFVTIYSGSDSPARMSKTEVSGAIRQLKQFLELSLNGKNRTIEEASPAFDMQMALYELREQLSSVRLFVLTDSICTLDETPDVDVNGIRVSVHIWDIVRLQRLATSGKGHEEIVIDLVGDFGEPIPCLVLPDSDDDYRPYLGVASGGLLARIYDRYGPRLLERNVRAFLEAKGKVNKGIRKTILDEPGRFLAYNNGIAATADSVEIIDLPDGGKGIGRIGNFQIVNGGQTTASLHRAMRKDKADLSRVHVQIKLSVVSPDLIEEVVPRISLFANTQNKVSLTDFSANDPFHVRIEELSRTVWAPSRQGTQRQTHWFYERARGQYADEKGRRTTPAQRRAFEAESPPRQKLTKTDLAKYENTWDQLPHVVSLGAEKNFRRFMLRLQERGTVTPDEGYFHRLIAKAVLFRSAEKIVGELELGGYRANVVTYTLALISHRTAQRIDLEDIWRRQELPVGWQGMIRNLAPAVYRCIVGSAGQRNVTEFCKKEACWEQVRGLEVEDDSGLPGTILAAAERTGTYQPRPPDVLPTDEERSAIEVVSQVPAETWLALSKWAKETNNLKGFQRSMAYNIGRALGRPSGPSGRLAIQGVKILEEAKRLGFRV